MSNMNISSGMIRVFNIMLVMFLMVHLMACFWYMGASFSDNMQHTWVGYREIIDHTSM